MSQHPLLTISRSPLAAARAFTPRIVGYEPKLAILIVPPATAPVTECEQDYDVWYDGAPDEIAQHRSANTHNARMAFWLRNPRREFWRVRARLSSASKGEA